MSLLVKRLFKINVHVTENKRISFLSNESRTC